MIENLEVEYKTMVNEDEFFRLLTYFPGNKTIIQTNHFFSSSSNAGLIFRIREIEGKYLFTYKEKRKDGKLEHEKYLDSLSINDPEVIDLLTSFLAFPPYHELATLTTIRHEVVLEDEATLCLDENIYGNKKDYEIEYEIIGPKGNIDSFKAILNLINKDYLPSPSSKQARAIKESLSDGSD